MFRNRFWAVILMLCVPFGTFLGLPFYKAFQKNRPATVPAPVFALYPAPTGMVLPKDLVARDSAAVFHPTAVPTATPTPTPSPTPTPTPKPAGPTPLPLGTSQSLLPGNLVFCYPEPAPVNTDTDTYTLIVNKEHTLPSDYIPYMVEPNVEIYHKGVNERRYLQPVAATALEEMFNAADASGVHIVLRCGFRSFRLQKDVYTYALKTKGYYEAANFHAIPGGSEHQTGLAVDLCCEATGYDNNFDIVKTPEYAWLLEHAQEYGWVMRYPEDKTAITGYNFEPWHFRYVGVELATYLKENNLVLEEYYGVPSTAHLNGIPKEYQKYMTDTEKAYMKESVEAYKLDPSGKTQPTPSPSPKPTKKPTPTPKGGNATPSPTPMASPTPTPNPNLFLFE